MIRRYKRASKIKEGAEPPSQERLSPDECAYHTYVVSTVRDAEDNLNLAKFAGERWFEYLMNRYGLAQQDIVDANGNIYRGNQ